MAIVNMKRIRILAMREDKEALLKLLQKLGSLQITKIDNNIPTNPSALDTSLEAIKHSIAVLNRYSNAKKPLIASDVLVSYDSCEDILKNKNKYLNIVNSVDEIEKEDARLSTELMRLDSQIAELEPWLSIDFPLDRIKSSKRLYQSLGVMSNISYTSALENQYLQDSDIYIEKLNEVNGQTYLYVLISKDDSHDLLSTLKKYGFNPVVFNESKSPKDIIEGLKDHKKAIANRKEDIILELTSLADNLSSLEVLYDALHLQAQRDVQDSKFLYTQESFLMNAWLPESMTEVTTKALKDFSPNLEFEILDAQEDEEIPVLMENKKIVKPFESVVSGFAIPSPNGLDPTALMMPFFANLFGMMLSDAGYGLVMLILIPIIIKKFNPKQSMRGMMKLLMWGGLATVIWGALYNTWFGFAPLPSLFDPISNPLPVMAICIAVGALHLFAGLGAAAYLNIKQGKYLDVLFDQVSWALLLVGLGLMLVPSLASVAKVLTILGLSIIILMAGREKKNFFVRIFSGLGALYGIMGWVSDLLSYMRLFGMGLATGVIGMVINKLIGMLFDGGIIGIIIGIPLFIFAHAFNLGINALGAYVHSCRLQYIEFFGKFYKDGGKEFRPLREDTRYVQFVDYK